jgi:transcription factor IIIB 90 kDa subunit
LIVEEKNKPANEDPASLSDVDDGEIESVMLDEEEVRNKTQVWYEFNKDWLVDQAIKKRKIEEDKKMGVHRPKPVSEKSR